MRTALRATVPVMLGFAAASLAACGALVVSTTAPASEAAPASQTASVASATPSTPTPTPTPATASTPSGPQLDISQFGIALTLSSGLGEVDYSIIGAGSKSGTDLKGNSYTELPSVALWTASLANDPACSAIEQGGLVEILVFSTDPTKLSLANGPKVFKQVGQNWYGAVSEQAQQCTDANPAELPAVQALMQDFLTIQAG